MVHVHGRVGSRIAVRILYTVRIWSFMKLTITRSLHLLLSVAPKCGGGMERMT
jgi:hypothetical protein